MQKAVRQTAEFNCQPQLSLTYGPGVGSVFQKKGGNFQLVTTCGHFQGTSPACGNQVGVGFLLKQAFDNSYISVIQRLDQRGVTHVIVIIGRWNGLAFT